MYEIQALWQKVDHETIRADCFANRNGTEKQFFIESHDWETIGEFFIIWDLF